LHLSVLGKGLISILLRESFSPKHSDVNYKVINTRLRGADSEEALATLYTEYFCIDLCSFGDFACDINY